MEVVVNARCGASLFYGALESMEEVHTRVVHMDMMVQCATKGLRHVGFFSYAPSCNMQICIYATFVMRFADEVPSCRTFHIMVIIAFRIEVLTVFQAIQRDGGRGRCTTAQQGSRNHGND